MKPAFLWLKRACIWAFLPRTLDARLTRVVLFGAWVGSASHGLITGHGDPWVASAMVLFGFFWMNRNCWNMKHAPMVRNVSIQGTISFGDQKVPGEIMNCHISQAPLREPIENFKDIDWSQA